MDSCRIVIFDGICNLCSASVNFIISRDPHAVFSFLALQSESGRTLLAQYGFDSETTQSIVLIEANSVFVKSDAVFRIAGRLSGFWKYLAVFKLLPKPLRDWLYDRIAANRYRWFGKKDVCLIPTSDVMNRFLSRSQ